ncbi:hypothetical protein FVEG_02473 [Fusarium verticillioides 7600]|uniref:Uncharacterized protein n=1 Tax=Gibberella moniliformis (strain M3125 / FGSC 7600) TaxID=334819 RepID=W7M4C2_GIBM7|nr:hypothetical protein FVEG_02473 [Fusarium verticillioides 7600]EWG39762.1 hypothetical protein FVEG_02473 [Fusarium verticillioides 7600]
MRQACQLLPFSGIFSVIKGVAKNRLPMYAYLEGELHCKEIIQQMTVPHTQRGQSHRFLQGFKGKKGYFAKLDMLSSHTSIDFHCYHRPLTLLSETLESRPDLREDE